MAMQWPEVTPLSSSATSYYGIVPKKLIINLVTTILRDHAHVPYWKTCAAAVCLRVICDQFMTPLVPAIVDVTAVARDACIRHF